MKKKKKKNWMAGLGFFLESVHLESNCTGVCHQCLLCWLIHICCCYNVTCLSSVHLLLLPLHHLNTCLCFYGKKIKFASSAIMSQSLLFDSQCFLFALFPRLFFFCFVFLLDKSRQDMKERGRGVTCKKGWNQTSDVVKAAQHEGMLSNHSATKRTQEIFSLKSFLLDFLKPFQRHDLKVTLVFRTF